MTWPAAALWRPKTDALADAIGVRQAPMGALLLAALRGNEPHSSTFIEAGIDIARSPGRGHGCPDRALGAAVLFERPGSL